MMRKRYVYRCSDGHLFTHSFWWRLYGGRGDRLVRFGSAGYMHCPVGSHSAWVKYVNESELTPEVRETLKLREHLDDRDGVKLNGSLYLLLGAGSLVHGIVTHSEWETIAAAVWITLLSAVYIRVLSSS